MYFTFNNFIYFRTSLIDSILYISGELSQQMKINEDTLKYVTKKLGHPHQTTYHMILYDFNINLNHQPK